MNLNLTIVPLVKLLNAWVAFSQGWGKVIKVYHKWDGLSEQILPGWINLDSE